MAFDMQSIEFEIKGNSSNASQALDNLAKSLKALKEATEGGLGLAAVAQEIKVLKEAASGLGEIAKAVTGLKDLSKIKISSTFTQGMSDMANAINSMDTTALTEFTYAMGMLNGIKVSGAALKNVALGVQQIGTAVDTITPESYQNLERFANAMSKLAGVDLTGVGSAMKAVASSGKERTPLPVDQQEAIRAGDALELLKLKLEALKASLNEAFAKGDLKGAISIRQQIGKVTEEIEKLEQAVKHPAIKMLESALEGLKTILRGTFGALKLFGKGLLSIGSSALKALKPLGKKAFNTAFSGAKDFAKGIKTVTSGLGRIAMYRLFRTAVKEIGEAFQIGVKDAYEWSRIMGGAVSKAGMTFAQAMDDMATSLLYFKNGIGSAAAPLLSALAPAIRVVTDAAVELLNIVNQLIALLTGASGWTKAIRQADEYGDAVGGAGGKAKEALRYLAPFDELNVLPDDKKGGGGGGVAEDYGGMFEEMTEFESGIKDFADRIKEAINAGKWEELGTLLGGKVNELVEKIDFAGMGTKIGGYINAWFTTKYWTLKETNFQKIGTKISEFLFGDGKDKKGVIGSIDWDTFGASIAQKFTILPDIIIGALDGINFTQLGEAIGKFVGGISEEFTNWLNTINWEQKGKDLVQDIVDLFSGLEDAGTAEKVAGFFTALWDAVKGLLTGIWKAAFNGETYTQPVDVNLSFSKASLTTPKTAKIPTVSLSDALTALTAGLLVYTITGNLVAASIVASLTLGFTSSHLDFDEIKDADEKTIKDYIKNLDEQFKDAKPGTYEYQYYQHFKSAAEAKLKEAAEAGGSAFHQSLEDGFSGRSGKFDFVGVKIPVTAKAVQIQDELTPTQKTFDTKAKFTSRTNSLSDKEKQFATVADFTSRVNDLSDKEKKFDTVANFNSRLNGLSDNEKKFSTVANFTSRMNSLSDNEKKFSTVANFNSKENNLGTPEFSSLAKINSYKVKDSLKTADGYFNLSTKIKVVGQDGTPTIKAKIQSTTISTQANGGVYRNGIWHDITQFASGGLARGSQLFWAREAGPELVGTLGGSTAVMNNDQIVASVSAGVARAIAGIHFQIRGLGTPQYADTNDTSEDMMYRAVSRALSEADFGGDIELDGDTLYRKMVNRNRQNTRLTGVNAMA